MRIAIVEDDLELAQLLKLVLSEITLDIKVFHQGFQAFDSMMSSHFDLVVLDVMLPGLNGMEICRKLRGQGKTMPILMLTSKSEEEDKVQGLDIGADDYITKPFSNKELLSRAKALLRRIDNQRTSQKMEGQLIRCGPISIHPVERIVKLNDSPIDLTGKEYDLLYLFMSNAGRCFTRQDLLEKIWGDNFNGLEHTVNSHINRLRMKIETDLTQPQFIITVWGVGYKFNNNI